MGLFQSLRDVFHKLLTVTFRLGCVTERVIISFPDNSSEIGRPRNQFDLGAFLRIFTSACIIDLKEYI